MIKILFQGITGLVFISIPFICSYWMFTETANIESNLDFYDKFFGIVAEKETTTNSSSVSGRAPLNLKILTFKIKDNPQTFGIYNSKEDYNDLDQKIQNGDSLKIYCVNNNSNAVNLSVFQIEKENKIIYGSQSYIQKERKGAYIALLGGFIMLGIFIVQMKKEIDKYYS